MSMQNEEDRLRALRDLGLLDTPPSEAFDRITRMASQLFDLPISAVSLTDKDRQWFKSRVGVEHWQLGREKAPCAEVATSRELVVLPDLLDNEYYRDSELAQAGIRFYAGAPLVTRDGFGLGSMCVLGPQPRTATPEELNALQDLAAMVMAQIELQHAFGRIDPVSELPNRNQFIEDLGDLARDHPHEARVAVLVDLVDSQQLAQGRRVLGPSYVDDLVKFAKAAIRPLCADTILYHVGATDLAFLLREGDEEMLGEISADIQLSLADFVESNGIPLGIHAAIGIAPFRLGETAPRDVLRTAYGAALDAREAERKIEMHSPAKDLAHQRRFGLLAALPAALAAPDQLSLVYQPRIDIPSGACGIAEALLRWTHPTLGEISPGEFIPLVEQTAFARQVTDWVLDAALSQAVAWKERGLEMRLSVNVFASNLEEEDFVTRLSEALGRHQIKPQMLELEFTEGALIRRRVRVLQHLQAIRALGVASAIDDFGTGYSSFSYLQKIPAQIIKIDRSFMAAIDSEDRDRTLVKAMIAMAHQLDYRVVAEGVETQEVYDFLAAAGCDEAQGYLIARPLPAESFRKWMAAKGRQAAATCAA